MNRVHPQRRPFDHDTRKKRPPEGWHLRAAASRACAENLSHDYYSKISAECKPKSGQGRRFSSVSWAMILTWIGAAGLVSQLARLIDWIERS